MTGINEKECLVVSTPEKSFVVANDVIPSPDMWPDFQDTYDVLSVGQDRDDDDEVHGCWHDMMDTEDDQMDWLQQSLPDSEGNQEETNSTSTSSSAIHSDQHQQLYPTKKRTSLDATETWLSEDDDVCLDMELGDENDNNGDTDDVDLDLSDSHLSTNHALAEEMIMTDNYLIFKEWDTDDCTATVVEEVTATNDTPMKSKVTTKALQYPGDGGASLTEPNPYQLPPLVSSYWNDIPTTITATTTTSPKHIPRGNDDHRGFDVDDDDSIDDAIMTLILEGENPSENGSINTLLKQGQQPDLQQLNPIQLNKFDEANARRPSITSYSSAAATVGSVPSTVSSTEGGKSFHDLFEERRAQLAASMEASRRSRTRCFLQSHVKTRASLACVLRDIERSSRVVAKNIVRYWEEQHRIQQELQKQQFQKDLSATPDSESPQSVEELPEVPLSSPVPISPPKVSLSSPVPISSIQVSLSPPAPILSPEVTLSSPVPIISTTRKISIDGSRSQRPEQSSLASASDVKVTVSASPTTVVEMSN